MYFKKISKKIKLLSSKESKAPFSFNISRITKGDIPKAKIYFQKPPTFAKNSFFNSLTLFLKKPSFAFFEGNPFYTP